MDAPIDRRKMRQEARKPILLLWPLLKPHKVKLVFSLIGMFVSAGGMLAIGWGFRHIIDRAFSGHSGTILRESLLMLFCVVLLMSGAAYMRIRLIYQVAERVINDLRKRLYQHLLTLDPAFFEQRKTGDQVSVINADTTVLQLVMVANMPTVVRHCLMLTGALIMLCFIGKWMIALVIGIICVVSVPAVYFGRKVRARSRETQNRVGDVSAFGHETLQGIQTIQSFGYEEEAARKFGSFADDVFETAMKQINLRALLVAYIIAAAFSAIGAVLLYGGERVLAGQMSPGDLSAFIFYAAIVAGSSSALTEALSEFSRAGGAADRITALLDARPGVVARGGEQLPRKLSGAISLRNVFFSYPTRPDHDVLSDVSFNIAPGEVVALVGPSGAGKTTVFQLLQRFYDPKSGTISIDGIDVTQCDPRDVRRHLSVVSQDPAIFSMSVGDNIRMAKPDASDEEVRHAAELAQAHEFISGLNLGYGTMVGERGSRLSGGQKQRIAIARAILKDSKILLLDEATSALDAANEIAVHKALKNLMQGRTTLIIAHRLSTVQNANRIVVMEQGHVVGEGSHEQLYAQKGLYAHLAGLQMDLKAS